MFNLKLYENRMRKMGNQLRKISEAVDISVLVKTLRDAVDSKDRAAEEKAANAIKKEMMEEGKKIQADLWKDFTQFVKTKEKELSGKFGIEVRLVIDGKPDLAPRGSNQSRFAVTSGFGFRFIVEPPQVS